MDIRNLIIGIGFFIAAIMSLTYGFRKSFESWVYVSTVLFTLVGIAYIKRAFPYK